ncbi:Rho-type gtpase-activating protein [Xylographa carneopallida]|nr:Rho-type gtpase-activating protein [Xylographa carneopallida]
MDAPIPYPESPMEDDVAYPCKGCGKILEEGKAFELAGNRWHIDCFRCNTCGTLLDSDANLLLLGDGSLICNNCTYSCSACGNKIEDLAILTGDHAFCASCFRCRNCKKQIENLRYARTSQGIFCMECHEGLMARRRKKSKTSRHKQVSNNAMLLDKSLPSLPPNAILQSAFSPDHETPPSDQYSDTPTELPADPVIKKSTKSRKPARNRSPPLSDDERRADNLTLPPTTYKSNRHSALSHRSDNSLNGDDYYIPMALDPNPAPGPSPLIKQQIPNSSEQLPKPNPRDYFNAKGLQSARKSSQDHENTRPTSRHDSLANSQPSSPHIAYLEKGREPTSEVLDTIRKRSVSGAMNGLSSVAAFEKGRDASPRNGDRDREKFKLQEVPKRRKSGSSPGNSRPDAISPALDTSVHDLKSKSAPASANVQLKEQHVLTTSTHSPKLPQSDSTYTASPRLSQDSKSLENGSIESPKSRSSPSSTQLQHLPLRGDSLQQSIPKRKEVGSIRIGSNSLGVDGVHGHSASPATSAISQDSPTSSANINGGRIISRPIESPISKSSTDFMQPPARAKDRPQLSAASNGDSFVSPRAPPHPPMEIYYNHKAKNESISTMQSESTRNGDVPSSPKLPRYSAGGEFNMAEDMARILGNDVQDPDQASFLRRVSNSVRHARSYSDRGTRLSREQKWPKSPLNGSISGKFASDINTPTNSSPEAKGDNTLVTSELRKLRQSSLEKDQRIAELEKALDSKANITQMNSELRKKRSTIVVLDTQKDMVIRELETMTDHIAKAKKDGEPLDVGKLTNVMLVDFADSLQKLKDSFAPAIEELAEQKQVLSEEISTLVKEQKKAMDEMEQLSMKNSQLAELHNQLINQLQSSYQQGKDRSLDVSTPVPQGLGIYTHHQKEKSNVSIESRDTRPSYAETYASEKSLLHSDHDAEPATILSAPQVVNIRKGQPKKFNWRKGGQNVAKGVTKGLKGAFTTTNASDGSKYQREGSITEGIPYGAMPQSQDYPTTTLPNRNAVDDPSRQGFGLWGNAKPKTGQARTTPNGNTPSVVAENPSVLYGSELEQRAEFERVNIPGIIIRCIEEVELRGMEIEGIYRKSGGNSQIQVVKEGFEYSNDFDISDPDLDINAVTSALKQYFRRLPTPLITWEVYDKLLDSTMAPDEGSRIELMRAAIGDLPFHHRSCLEFLIFHLQRVVMHERQNLMTPLNVAVVFAPTIMRPESITREMSDTQLKNQAVQFLIEHCEEVFLKAVDDK